MKYCSECAATLSVKVPAGDTLPRHVCERCGTVHYQNPKIVAGCIATWDDRLLLCRRAIEPRCGKWTVPAGFMENGETVVQAAARETVEEACARVHDLQLLGLFNLTHVNQVYIMFRGRLRTPEFAAGPESLEVALVTEAQIPWDELAFTVVTKSLQLFLGDRARGRFDVHVLEVPPRR